MKNVLKLRISNVLYVMALQDVLNVNFKTIVIAQLSLNYVSVKNVRDWEIHTTHTKNH